MFKLLCENPEIRNFLNNFPSHHRRRAIEKISIIGIRRVESQHLPPTLETLETLTSEPELNHTLNTLKQELKHLTSSIKKIERKTLSSSDILKDRIPSIDTRLDFEYKQRTNSCKGNQAVHFESRSQTPAFLLKKELKEPKICPLKEAKHLIKFLNVPKVLSVGNEAKVSYFNAHRKREKLSKDT